MNDKSLKKVRDLPILFSGKHIRVYSDNVDRPRTLMTFSHWNKRGPINPGLAEAAGMGFVGFVALQNHWWQTHEFVEALKAVICHLNHNPDVVAFGSSMGGAGALLAAQFVPVTTVLAIAPPIIVDVEYAPWEERFQNVAHLTKQIYALGPNANPETRTFIAYDPFFKDDVNHLQLMTAAGRSFTRWPLAFSKHTPLLEVSKAGLYRDFTTAFFVNNDPKAAHAILRAARSRRGMIDMKFRQRAGGFGRARFNAPEYIRCLTSLIEKYGEQIEMLHERAKANMIQGRPDLAVLDFERCCKLENRRRFQNNLMTAQLAVRDQVNAKMTSTAK